MFERLPSLKDVIVYFIPGVLSSYFLASIYICFAAGNEEELVKFVSASPVTITIAIFCSLILGFLLSQFQIIVFNWIFDRVRRRHDTLRSCGFLPDYQKDLIECIRAKFKLATSTDDDILDDHNLYVMCHSYVRERGTDNTFQYIDRQKSLSSLAIALVLPIFLCVVALHLRVNGWYFGGAVPISLLGIFTFEVVCALLIWKNFFRGFVTSNFIFFQILATKP